MILYLFLDHAKSCLKNFIDADLQKAEGLAAFAFKAGVAGGSASNRDGVGGFVGAAEGRIGRRVDGDDRSVESTGEVHGACVIRDKKIHLMQKGSKGAQ